MMGKDRFLGEMQSYDIRGVMKKVFITVNNKRFEVELLQRTASALTFTCNGESFQAAVEPSVIPTMSSTPVTYAPGPSAARRRVGWHRHCPYRPRRESARCPGPRYGNRPGQGSGAGRWPAGRQEADATGRGDSRKKRSAVGSACRRQVMSVKPELPVRPSRPERIRRCRWFPPPPQPLGVGRWCLQLSPPLGDCYYLYPLPPPPPPQPRRIGCRAPSRRRTTPT